MTDKIPPELLERLDKLAEKLGATGELLWAALVRSEYVDGLTGGDWRFAAHHSLHRPSSGVMFVEYQRPRREEHQAHINHAHRDSAHDDCRADAVAGGTEPASARGDGSTLAIGAEVMAVEYEGEVAAVAWERLGALEELVDFAYDKLDIVFEGESSELVIEGSDA